MMKMVCGVCGVVLTMGAVAWGGEATTRPGEVPDILLSTYRPKSTEHLPETRVERAKFPVIDIHTHLNDAGAIMRKHEAAADIVKWMDKRNIQTIVIVSGGSGERLQRVIDEMVRPFPGRFVVFCQPDWKRIDEEGYGEKMAEMMRDSVRRGARGLKITKELGLNVRDKAGKLVAVDDRRLDAMWEEARKLGIPVIIHTGDPEAFFRPIDVTNERYEQLRRKPEYRFVGKDYPAFEELLGQLERVFARHPKTTFISAHMGNWPENLEYVDGILTKYPNVVVEFGARQAELGRKPNQTRKFFLKWSDRVLFGTDSNEEAAYPSYFRWLETDDDYFEPYMYPGQGRWKIDGLKLPDEVLEKIYGGNARRVLEGKR